MKKYILTLFIVSFFASTKLFSQTNCATMTLGATASNTAPACGSVITLSANCTNCINQDNVVTNGDFELGNTGFSADNQSAGSITTLVADGWPKEFPRISDHTTGQGNVLFHGASGLFNEKMWYQQINVQPNTTYNLSFYISTVINNQFTNVFFEIDGVKVQGQYVFSGGDPALGKWVKFTTTWTSTSQTNVQLAIRRTNTVNPKDFAWIALDDIEMRDQNGYRWTGPNGFQAIGNNIKVQVPSSQGAYSYSVQYNNQTCSKTAQVTVNVPTCSGGGGCNIPSTSITQAAGLLTANCAGCTNGTNLISYGAFNASDIGNFNGNYVQGLVLNSDKNPNYSYDYKVNSSDYGFSPSHPDHTGNGGYMMFHTNSNLHSKRLLWQTFDVTPNTPYEFTYWVVKSIDVNGQIKLSVEVNGELLAGTEYQYNAPIGQWIQKKVVWRSGKTQTKATFAIRKNDPLREWEWLAIDDLSLVEIPSYYWSGPNVPAGSTQSTVSIPSLTTGIYKVITKLGTCEKIAILDNCQTPSITASKTVICVGEQISLTASNCSGNISWSNGAVANSITINPTITTTYSATCNYNECTKVANVSITVNPLPTHTVNNATICAGQTGTLTASECAGNISWNTGAATPSISVTNAGTYMAVCTLPTGCSKAVSGVVTVNPLPTHTVNNATICAGQTGTLTASGCVGNISWNTGAATPSISVTNAGTYMAVCTLPTGCSKAVSGVVTVNPLPTHTVNNATICAGQTGTLTASGCVGNISWNTGAATSSISVTNAGVYTATCTLATGCSKAVSGVLTVNPLPTPTVNSPTICVGACASLTVGNCAGTISWSNSLGANPTVSVCPTSTTTYTATCTLPTGCSASVNSTVTVNPLPTHTVNNATICAGQTGTLTASGCAGTISWNTGAVTPSISVTNAGVYTATCTLASGCSKAVSGVLTVNPLPTPTVNSPTICVGTCASLTVSNCAGTISWSNSLGANPTVSVCPTSTTTYTATCTLATGCSASINSTVTVNPLPTHTVNNATICSGQTGTLTASGCAGTISWNTGAATSSISVTNAGVYTATCTLASGCSKAVSGVLTVNPLPTPTVNSPTICVGTCASLTVGNCAGTISWSNSLGANPTVSVCPTSTTTYTATCTLPTGCSASINSTITVNPLPTHTVNNATICSGQTGTLTASGCAGTIVWNTGAVTPSISVTNAGVYTATCTLATGCSKAVSGVLTVNPLPTPTVNSPTICVGTCASLTVGNCAGTISWSNSLGANPTVSVCPTSTTTYTATCTLPTGCSKAVAGVVTVNPLPTHTVNNATICAGQTGTLTASGCAGTISWNTGAATSSISVTNAGVYTATCTLATGCSKAVSGVLTVNPLPTPTVNSPTICVGACASLTVSNCAGTIAWSNSLGANPTVSVCPTSTTTYTATCTLATGCSASINSTVTVNPLPTHTVNNATICSGQTGTLTASGCAGTISWNTGAVTPSISVTNAGVYTATCTLATGCSKAVSGVLTVNPLPTPSVSGTTICEENTINLLASGGTTYLWTGPNGFNSTLQNPSINNATIAMNGTYSVAVTNANNCTINTTVLVIVNPLPNPSVNNQTICAGQTATLNISNCAGKITWTNSGATTTSISVTTSGTYIANCVLNTGCSKTASGVVTVNPLPTHTVNNATICSGQSATLTVNNCAGTISWNTNPVSTTTSISVTNAGTYTATCTLSTTCSSTASGVVTVNQLPTHTVNSATICSGQSAILTVSNCAGTILWNTNATSISISVTSPGTYTAKCTLGTGCFSTSAGVVIVNPLPNPSATGAIVCVGKTINLSSTGGGTYAWSGPNSYTSAVQNPIINNASTTMAGTYILTVTNSNGCTATASANVTVNTLPNPTASGAVVCVGNSINLSSTGGGTYTWSGPNSYTSAVQNPIINNASTAMAGTYILTVTNSNGCTATASANVTVNTLPSPSATGAIVCVGKTINLSSTGGGTYAWSGPNSYTSAVQNPIINNASTAMAGTYILTVTNANGCTATASANVTVNTLPNPTASGAVVCVGNSINLSSTGGGTYTWSGPNSYTSAVQNPIINNASTAMAGTYILTVTNSNGCTATASANVTVNTLPSPSATGAIVCVGKTINLSSTGGGTYAWSGPNSYTSAVQNPIINNASTAMAGTYILTVTNANGCTATTSANVSVNTLPNPTASGAVVCVGNSINLSSTGGGTYAWSGPNSYTSAVQNPSISNASTAMAGTYILTVTNSNGCTATASTNVTVNTLPSPTATGAVVCVGNSINLSSTGGGTYAWIGPNSYTSAVQNPIINNASTAMAGTYILTVTNSNGCTATASANVTVNTLPSPSATGAIVCVGKTINLSSTGGGTYAWSGPNSYTSAVQNPSISNASTAMAGTYILTVTNSNGCTATASANVTVNTLPSPTVNNLTICANDTTGKLTISNCAGAVLWNTGKTTSIISVANPGTYSATCTLPTTCSNTASGVVTVTALPTMPNIVASRDTVCAGMSLTLTAQGCVGTITWSNNSTTTSISVTPTSTTTYNVYCTANACASPLVSKIIVVNPIPSPPILSPISASICQGDSILVSSSACANGTINWNNGKTGNSFYVKANTVNNISLTATCKILGCVSASSLPIVITVKPKPLIPSVVISKKVICAGDTTQLTAIGCEGGTFVWQHNSSSSQVLNVIPQITTIYKIKCTLNGCSSNFSQGDTVIVKPKPEPVFVAPRRKTICQSDSVIIDAIGCAGGQVLWTDQNEYGTSITRKPTQTTIYKAICIINGCQSISAQDTVKVTIPPIPFLSSSRNNISANDTITIFASGCTGTLLWSNGITTSSFVVNPLVTTDYFATCTVNGCTSIADNKIRIFVQGTYPPKIQVLARLQAPIIGSNRVVKIRWVPNTSPAWRKGNTFGYKVERYEVGFDQPTVIANVVKPLGVALWDTTDENQKALAVAIYNKFDIDNGDGIKIPMTDTTKRGASDVYDPAFIVTLLTTDQDFSLAQKAGLAAIDNTAMPNKNYYYRVTPLTTPNELTIDWVFSNNVNTQQLLALAPVPTPIADFNKTQVALKWANNQADSTYIGFHVERSTDGTNFVHRTKKPISIILDANVPFLNFSDTLENKTIEYHYRIVGITPFDEQIYSSIVKGKAKQSVGFQTVITSAKMYNDTPNAEIKWGYYSMERDTLVTNINGSIPIGLTKVEIRKAAKDTTWQAMSVAAILTDTTKISHLVPSITTTTYFKVVAYTSKDTLVSFSELVQPVDSIPPLPPAGLRYSFVRNVTVADSLLYVKLEWNDNTEPDLKGYRLYRSNRINEEPIPIMFDSLVKVFVDTVSLRLLNNKIYYRLKAVDKRYNQSGFSTALVVNKPDVVPPSSPVFRSYKIDSLGVHLSWINSEDADVAKHTLYRRMISDEANADTTWRMMGQFPILMADTAFIDSDVEADSVYAYSVIATDSVGLESEPSSPILVQIPISFAPRPTISSLSAVSDSTFKRIKLAWIAPTVAGVGVSQFQIYKGSDYEQSSFWKTLYGDETTLYDTELEPDNTYNYSIRAIYSDGTSSRWVTVSVDYFR